MQGGIAIIGGGASGMMAAVSAAQNGAKVTILEATKRIGNKILLTGNGKCNFTNAFMDKSCFYCKEEALLEKTLEKFSNDALKTFFQENGMLCKEKNGYFYPLGEQASIVLDILRQKIEKLGITVLTECKVSKIVRENEVFLIETEGGKKLSFQKVIITTGGRSYPKTGSDGSGYKLAKKLGHSVYPTVPALVQLCGKDEFYKTIAGVRSEGTVTLYMDDKPVKSEHGEIQFTDYGISGIPVFQISRMAAYGLFEKKAVCVVADVLPDIAPDALKNLVSDRALLHKEGSLEKFFLGLCNKKLCNLAIQLSGKKPDTLLKNLKEKELYEMVLSLKNICFHIVDTKGYDTAQVTAGGVPLSEITEDFQSKFTKDLYLAGEILDVDAICGGYNLQWAFSSGYVAGKHAGEKHD